MSVDALIREIRGRADRGRELWAYRLTDDELEGLRGGLKRAFERNHADRSVAMAFCLFAAHHFCRHHEGGAWKWESIIEPVGWEHGVGAKLYRLVEEGLKGWGLGEVLVRGERRYFHRTLAYQGGLPLKLMRSESSHRLRAFLRRLLRLAERYDEDPVALAPRVGDELPSLLRTELVFEPAGRLVQAIIELRQRHGGEPGWFQRLDEREPGWRSTLPIHADTADAQELLAGLLDAPREASPSDAHPVEVGLWLRLDGAPRLIRRARVALRAGRRDLERLLQRSGEELPPYFELSLLLPDGSSQLIATARLQEGGETFRIERELPERPIRRGAGLFGELRLLASVGGDELGLVDVPGGAAVATELPWALAGTKLDGDLPVVAMGSARTAAQRMFVLLPPEGELVLEPNGRQEVVSEIAIEGRRLVAIEGSATFESEDGDLCRFVTSSKEDEHRFLVRGKARRFGFAGSEVFEGAPRVFEFGESGPREVPSGELEWRPARGFGGWRAGDLGSARGDVTLRVRREGETHFKAKATIVPPGLRADLALEIGGEGRLELSHPSLRGVQAEAEAEAHVEVSGAQGEFTVRANGNALKALSLDVHLLFEGAAEARLALPWPLRRLAFVDFSGAPLPASDVRGLDGLGSVRAVAVGYPKGEEHVLEARLRADEWRTVGKLVPREGSNPGLRELSLERIRPAVGALLAGSMDLRTKVDVRIAPFGGALHPGQPRIEVRRHDLELEPTRDGVFAAHEVRLTPAARQRLGDRLEGLLRVDIRPLLDAGEQARPLEEIEPGRWAVPWADLTPGPWLAVGWQGEWARLSPLCISKDRELSVGPDSGPLRRARALGREEERLNALPSALDELEADLDHPEWGDVQATLKTFETLHPLTFDLSRALARRPAALLMALCRTEASPVVWEGFERLPFLWAAVPITDWVRAFRRIVAWASANPTLCEIYDGPRAAATAYLRPFARGAIERAQFAKVVLELLSTLLPFDRPPTEPMLGLARTSPNFIDAWRGEAEQSLHSRNEGRRWPTPSLEELEPELHAALPSIELPMSRIRRAAVVQAPELVALASVRGRELGERTLFEIRQLRAFDRDYFDRAHALALTSQLAASLDRNPGAYDDVR